ncbi:MATE family efflux transporter [uncultured Dysosmobacter sp.]|uniref:MATE family efflux transporter n=1 Tax=uncultured Dysosmobacter sp. TaxID=2591384 RepID=UPI0026195300|nr:MATE family efflux transporter [uncultured Dysosmobacter sp.]
MHSLTHTAGQSHDVDMTTGSVFRHLLYFSLPLLAGNIFQQLYNTVDTWVVGNYVSNEAFSAVGTVAPIINMLIGTFMGLSSGAGVVISQYYGAKNEEKVHDAVHTSIVITVILTIAFTALGVGMTPTMLRFMKTPAEVFPESTAYLTIYFGGMAGLLFYNMGAAILRAVGDSRRPFYFLVVAAVINTVLDLVFVIVFQMGVRGVAYATIIAQGVSALLTLATLLRTSSWVQVIPRDLRLHMDILTKIIRVGIPAALQMAVTAFSNVFVQSYINVFGADCMGGWTAYHKIDQLIFLPMQSLSLAATTFVGQNLGVRQVSRAKQGTRTALFMSMAVTLLISAAVILFAPGLVAFFNDKPEVVTFGTLFLRHLTPFYVLCCLNQVYAGSLRGAGNSRAPMLIMLLSFVLFRQAYLYIMANFISNAVLPIAMGYPAGWLVCSALILLYYRHAHLERNVLVTEDQETAN